MEIARGIGLGIGITLGVIIAIIVIGLLIALIIGVYKYSLRRTFSTELFRLYKKELLREEKFEELGDVNQLIDQFKKNEKPKKEILQKYKVDVESYLYWAPTYNGGERLVFMHEKRIVKRPIVINSKKN